MAYKDPLDERAREARRKHYKANKEQYYARNKIKERELRELIDGEKAKPCMDCGVQYPSYVMDFDHRDPALKLVNVGKLVKFGSRQKVIDEIAKCDLVCANCHRERTHGSRG